MIFLIVQVVAGGLASMFGALMIFGIPLSLGLMGWSIQLLRHKETFISALKVLLGGFAGALILFILFRGPVFISSIKHEPGRWFFMITLGCSGFAWPAFVVALFQRKMSLVDYL